MRNPFRYFNSSPAVIRTAALFYIRFPLALRHVEDLLHERGIAISHETVRFWWNRFGPVFAAELRRKQRKIARQQVQWRWHLDEVFIRVNGERLINSRILQDAKIGMMSELAEIAASNCFRKFG